MTGSWFRSKRFRVEGAPSSLFAVLSPVKRAGEGLSPGRRAEEGLPRCKTEEQRPPSSSEDERQEKSWERRQKSEERHGERHRERHGETHGERHEDMEQERKPYSFSVSSSYHSAVNRQAFFLFNLTKSFYFKICFALL